MLTSGTPRPVVVSIRWQCQLFGAWKESHCQKRFSGAMSVKLDGLAEIAEEPSLVFEAV